MCSEYSDTDLIDVRILLLDLLEPFALQEFIVLLTFTDGQREAAETIVASAAFDAKAQIRIVQTVRQISTDRSTIAEQASISTGGVQ